MGDAYANLFDRMILVTADADQVPTIQHIRERFPGKRAMIAVPPGRLTIARQLCESAHEHREVKAGRLEACMLPRSVYDTAGRFIAAMPAIYIPAVVPH